MLRLPRDGIFAKGQLAAHQAKRTFALYACEPYPFA